MSYISHIHPLGLPPQSSLWTLLSSGTFSWPSGHLLSQYLPCHKSLPRQEEIFMS